MLIQNNHSQFCGIYFQARVAAANKTKSGQAATAPKKIERAVFIDDISGQQTEFGADTARVINAKSSQVVVSSGRSVVLQSGGKSASGTTNRTNFNSNLKNKLSNSCFTVRKHRHPNRVRKLQHQHK